MKAASEVLDGARAALKAWEPTLRHQLNQQEDAVSVLPACQEPLDAEHLSHVEEE
jgi:hypothetical protein